MKIERVTIKNYKVFRHVEIHDLSNMSIFLGANGAGKSTLFDVFGFLSDALKTNVRTALGMRGGFKEVISRGVQNEPIHISITFRNDEIVGEGKIASPPIHYELSIGLDDRGLPVVERELLKYRRGNSGSPWKFLDFSRGTGEAITNEEEYGQGAEAKRDTQTLDSPDILAINQWC
jgi:predicted ATPase